MVTFLTCLFPHTKIILLKMHCSVAWKQKLHREHTGGFFRRQFCCHSHENFVTCAAAQLWVFYYSSPYWTLSEKCAGHLLIRQKRNLPSGPQRNFMCEGRPCTYNLQIYQNVILLSQNIFFPLKRGFLWKSPTFVAQNGTLSVISWINTPCNTRLSGGQLV